MRQYSAFRSLPLPSLNPGGERYGGNTFQHRLPRTALCRWPAAPPPHDAVAALGGFVVLAIPQPAFGPSEPSDEVSAGGAYPVFSFVGTGNSDDSSRLTTKRK
jgi:hypothetical protein